MKFLKQLSSPPRFYALASKMWMPLALFGSLLLLVGLYTGLFVAPVDRQQGEVYRAIYVHVPTAWMSMFLYLVASGYAAIYWVYRTDVSAVMMRAFLPTGAWMTLIALVTGALWGKPTWGSYWVWDARMTSELLLLFIYLGLMAVAQMASDPSKADRLLSIATMVGAANIPLIYLSVKYFNTLHQGYSVKLSESSIHPDIAIGMWLCVFGFWIVCASNVLNRARHLLSERRAVC